MSKSSSDTAVLKAPKKAKQTEMTDTTSVLAEVNAFYLGYYDALDEMRLEEWPEFFTEETLYRVVSRENYVQGLRLSTIYAESRGMLEDRVVGLRKTQVYAPRYYRRFSSPVLIRSSDADGIKAEHNLLIAQTMQDKQSDIVLTARCYDVLVKDGEALKLKSREVVYDSEMIPNSLIYPA